MHAASARLDGRGRLAHYLVDLKARAGWVSSFTGQRSIPNERTQSNRNKSPTQWNAGRQLPVASAVFKKTAG